MSFHSAGESLRINQTKRLPDSPPAKLKPLDAPMILPLLIFQFVAATYPGEVTLPNDRACEGALARFVASQWPVDKTRDVQLASISARSDYSPRDCDSKVAQALQEGGFEKLNRFAFTKNLYLLSSFQQFPSLIKLSASYKGGFRFKTVVGDPIEWYGIVFVEQIDGRPKALIGSPDVNTPPLSTYGDDTTNVGMPVFLASTLDQKIARLSKRAKTRTINDCGAATLDDYNTLQYFQVAEALSLYQSSSTSPVETAIQIIQNAKGGSQIHKCPWIFHSLAVGTLHMVHDGIVAFDESDVFADVSAIYLGSVFSTGEIQESRLKELYALFLNGSNARAERLIIELGSSRRLAEYFEVGKKLLQKRNTLP